MSEELLINHCAPTLAGIKTGNMFSCPCHCKERTIKNICLINRNLVPKGLYMVPLQFSKNRVLVYIYRPKKLFADFLDDKAQALLKEFGYTSGTPEQYVRKLIHRFKETNSFPHEVGLFLSYPPEDVRGFMENKAAEYKCVGSWKVYGNIEEAQKTFDKYKRCTKYYCEQWSKGTKVEQLAVAV